MGPLRTEDPATRRAGGFFRGTSFRGSLFKGTLAVGLCGPGPALAGKLWGRINYSRCARGVLVFASYARSVPDPLPPVTSSGMGSSPFWETDLFPCF